MKCPNCGLQNPPESLRCDCGFDFETSSIGSSFLGPASRVRSRPAPTVEATLLQAAFLFLGALALVLLAPLLNATEFGSLLETFAFIMWVAATIILAQAKGWHWGWGLLGLSLLGALIVVFLPIESRIIE